MRPESRNLWAAIAGGMRARRVTLPGSECRSEGRSPRIGRACLAIADCRGWQTMTGKRERRVGKAAERCLCTARPVPCVAVFHGARRVVAFLCRLRAVSFIMGFSLRRLAFLFKVGMGKGNRVRLRVDTGMRAGGANDFVSSDETWRRGQCRLSGGSISRRKIARRRWG